MTIGEKIKKRKNAEKHENLPVYSEIPDAGYIMQLNTKFRFQN